MIFPFCKLVSNFSIFMIHIRLISLGLFTLSFLYSAFGQTSEGNVGIGTTAPTEKLDVAGSIKFSGELKPGGLSGQQGDVLQSNGDALYY